MASTYILKNLSAKSLIACMGAQGSPVDEASLEAYAALLRVAGAILASTDSQLEKHGISQGRLRLLAQLRLKEADGLAPWELADHLGISRATITRFLDGLQRDGLIERIPSKADRRSLVVRLSPRGAKLIRALLPERVRRIQALMAGLGAGDKKRLVALLSAVEANLPSFEGRP